MREAAAIVARSCRPVSARPVAEQVPDRDCRGLADQSDARATDRSDGVLGRDRRGLARHEAGRNASVRMLAAMAGNAPGSSVSLPATVTSTDSPCATNTA